MSLTILKQNAEILLEISQNYEKILKENKNEEQIKNFRKQFLYLLTSINKNLEQEKNVR